MSYVLFDTFYNVRNVRKAHLNCGFCTFINVSQRHKFNVPFPMCVDTFLVLTGPEVRLNMFPVEPMAAPWLSIFFQNLRVQLRGVRVGNIKFFKGLHTKPWNVPEI